MKITIENYGKKMSVETDNEDLSIEEYTNIINTCLLGIGFHQGTILDGLREFIQEREL